MINVQTTLYPATEKQIAFLASLLAQREVPADLHEEVSAFLPTADKRRASDYIERLLALPKTQGRPAAAAPAANAVFDGVPVARYAIPAEEISLLDVDPRGDLLFVEVKTWKGVTYMRRLHGSLGGFSRSKMPRETVADLASILARDPYRYTRLFGEHYSCCGKCGAELTDEESRRLMLGPVCRKAFGY